MRLKCQGTEERSSNSVAVTRPLPDLTYVLSKQLMYSVMLYMTALVQYFLKCLQVFVAIYLCNIYSDGAVIVYFSCSNITEQIARAV